jgi:hypothetical protein
MKIKILFYAIFLLKTGNFSGEIFNNKVRGLSLCGSIKSASTVIKFPLVIEKNLFRLLINFILKSEITMHNYACCWRQASIHVIKIKMKDD